MGCGVVGLIPGEGDACSELAYCDLVLSLTDASSNRGQNGTGVLRSGYETDAVIERWEGTADEIPDESYDRLKEGDEAVTIGIGHARYGTKGDLVEANIHPVRASLDGLDVWMSMNGQLNYTKRWVEDDIDYHDADNDTVQFAGRLARLFWERNEVGDALIEAYKEAFPFGGFSIVGYLDGEEEDHMFWMRDGLRPLHYAAVDGDLVVVSETAPLTRIGVDWEDIDVVPPGSVGFYDLEEREGRSFAMDEELAGKASRGICSFELAYFQKPNSMMYGESIDAIRQGFGEELAEEHPAPEGSVVSPVPRSGRSATTGFANALLREDYDVDQREVIIRWKGSEARSFILEGEVEDLRQVFREKFDFTPVADEEVVAVDDSVVRGNMSSYLVRLFLDELDADGVHFRSAWPPIVGGCDAGIDMKRDELLASMIADPSSVVADHAELEGLLEDGYDHEVFDVVRYDSMGYVSPEAIVERIEELSGREDFCTGCFSGEYSYIGPVVFEEEAFGYADWLDEFIEANDVPVPDVVEKEIAD